MGWWKKSHKKLLVTRPIRPLVWQNVFNKKFKILDITVKVICDKQFADITRTEKIILGNFSIDLLPEVDAGRKIDRPTKKIKDQTDRREMIYELTLQ